MITHQDLLQNKVKNLQKLIDELDGFNIGGIKFGKGVIVDLTVDNINTKNIKNSNLIQTNQLRANNSILIYGPSSYVLMKFDSRLYIDESVYLRANHYFFQNDTTFLFDTDATLYFARQQSEVLHGNTTFKCVAHGFYNRSNGYALISTGFVLTPLGDTKQNWGVLLGFVINGMRFDCIYYDGLGTTSESFSTSIPGNTGNNPLTPPIMGNIEICNVTSNIYKNRIDTDTRYYCSLFCYSYKISLDGTSEPRPVYVLSYADSTDFDIGVTNLCVKFTDVLMKKA